MVRTRTLRVLVASLLFAAGTAHADALAQRREYHEHAQGDHDDCPAAGDPEAIQQRWDHRDRGADADTHTQEGSAVHGVLLIDKPRPAARVNGGVRSGPALASRTVKLLVAACGKTPSG